MYCVHCGSEMHDRANFCPKCGKPTPAFQAASVKQPAFPENSTPVEKVTPVKEAVTEEAVAEEAVAEEAVTEEAVAEEAIAEEAVTEEAVAEEAVTEEAVAEEAVAEEAVTEEAVTEEGVAEEATTPVNLTKAPTVEDIQPAIENVQPVDPPQKKKSNGTAKKNIVSSVVFVVSAALVAGLGIFVVPKIIYNPVFEKVVTSNSDKAFMTFHKAANRSSDADDIKFTIAKKALDDGDFAYAAALFAELNNQDYDTKEDLKAYVDEAFSGRCRVLLNGGKYLLAMADSTQISDKTLRAGINNDTIISKAKILSAEGKAVEAYETLVGIDMSAAYDSEAYNIIVYNYAVGFYNNSQFDKAYDILKNSTDEASVELCCASAYYMANDYLSAKKYDKALEMYIKADNYSDAKERVKQCNYHLGVKYYNMDRYDTALEYFTAADGYNDTSSYMKKIEEKTAYTGWKVDGYTTNYIDTLTGKPNPAKTRISASDYFIYYFTTTNINDNTNGVDITVKITTPDGQTASDTFTNVRNGDVNCYISQYEYPIYGSRGTAEFTVTLAETGEVLDTCYFEIY